jgi:hypothetical protein
MTFLKNICHLQMCKIDDDTAPYFHRAIKVNLWSTYVCRKNKLCIWYIWKYHFYFKMFIYYRPFYGYHEGLRKIQFNK